MSFTGYYSHFGELCFPKSPKSDKSASGGANPGTLSTCVYNRQSPSLTVLVCLFVCLFVLCVCTVTDFSDEDKASGVKFCTLVHGRLGQGIAHFGELCFTKSQKSDESVTNPELKFMMGRATVIACLSISREVCGRRIGRFRRRTYLLEMSKVWIY